MTGLDASKRWNLAITQAFFGNRTAGMEGAAARRIEGARHVTLQQEAPFSSCRVGLGSRAQQGLGVWMAGVFVDLLRGRELDDAAQVHDGYAAANMLHHMQVVRDEQIAQPELFLKIAEKVHDLRLNGDVERTDRLVGDDEAW